MKQRWREAAAATAEEEEWTYSSSLDSLTVGIGHSRPRLHRVFPAAEEAEEQLGEEAAAIVRLQEEGEWRSEQRRRARAQKTMHK